MTQRLLIPLLVVLLIGLPAAYLLSGFFSVPQDEVAVVLRFGAYHRTVSSGLHYHWPRPFERIYRLRTGSVYFMPVGYRITDRLQGVPPSEKEMQWLTGDTNLINIRLQVQYRIVDPVKFLFSTEEPHFLVRRASQAVLTEVAGQTPVDTLLTYGKTEVARRLKEEVQAMLERYQCGLAVRLVNVEALEPPEQVVSFFHEVKSAERQRDQALVEAEGYRRNLMAQTQGEKQNILTRAEADADARIARARADSGRFESLLAEYRKAPEVFAGRLYLESLTRVLPNIQIHLVPEGEEGPPDIRIFLEETR